jgi:hypothetical protein
MVRRMAGWRDALVKRTRYAFLRRWVSPHLRKKRRGEFDDTDTFQRELASPDGEADRSLHFALYAH